MNRYRAKLKADHECNTTKSSLLSELRRLRSIVKNTLAEEVTRHQADVWLISRGDVRSVKNYLANAQVIVLASAISPPSLPEP